MNQALTIQGWKNKKKERFDENENKDQIRLLALILALVMALFSGAVFAEPAQMADEEIVLAGYRNPAPVRRTAITAVRFSMFGTSDYPR